MACWCTTAAIVCAVPLVWFLVKFFSRSPKTITLPNKLEIKQLNTWETNYLFQEIWTEKSYFKHGIQLQDGATVFDIGANIGLFSMHVANLYKNLKIFAFEPIPDTFAVMEANVRKHCTNTPASNLNLMKLGVSGPEREISVDFVCDPFVSVAASTPALASSTATAWKAISLQWASAFMKHQHRLSGSFLSLLCVKLIAVPVLGSLVAIIVFLYQTLIIIAASIRKAIFSKKVPCTLVSLAKVMSEHKVERIDLLKVDVEGAEFDVLRGVDESDWPKIQQVVLEVHNIGGTRTKEIKQFLEQRGFTVNEECEEELFALMGMSSLFCVRSKKN